MTNPLYASGEPPSLSSTPAHTAISMYAHRTADAAVGHPHGHSGGQSDLGPAIGTKDADSSASADDGYDTVERTVTTTEVEPGGGGGGDYINVTSDDVVYAVAMMSTPC